MLRTRRTSRRTPQPLAGATLVRRKPSLDFSGTGLVYSTMMMFMGLAAVNTQANLLFGVFGLMIGALLVAGVISRSVLRQLRVERELPEAVTVGQPAAINYRFHNRKRFWPSLSVGLAELDGNEAFARQPHSYMLHAAPGQSAVVPTSVVPKRRGMHELNRFQLSTSFPFGFIKRAIDRNRRDWLLVYPALGEVDQRLLAMCRSAEKTGPTMRPRRGGMDEFYGVKEYRSGDNPRWIYWRRSARTGVLVSKEMTRVSPPRLLLMVDSYVRTRSAEEHEAVERAIAMAASLANVAMEQGISVGLLAWDQGWVKLPPNRGKRPRRELLSALAALSLNQAHDAEALLDESRRVLTTGTTPRVVQMGLAESRQGSLVVVCSMSMEAEHWFRFPNDVDFRHCMPVEQQPELAAAGQQRVRGQDHSLTASG